MPIQTGTRLGSYEIVAAIGAGGMGEVYRARDAKLQRVCKQPGTDGLTRREGEVASDADGGAGSEVNGQMGPHAGPGVRHVRKSRHLPAQFDARTNPSSSDSRPENVTRGCSRRVAGHSRSTK